MASETQEFVSSVGSAIRTEGPGAIIDGRYKLLERIGEGGMGEVFAAEQTAPVRRKVALKLIRAGMDSRSVIARFEAERQALAVMDHPNIARVLDAGLTEQNRPYFAMEYIPGIPLNKYCDDARLTPRQRLELFIPICQAVQHAHQKGIIHRDLKPSNILVTLIDDRPVPKVIDFGVAKATGPRLTGQSLYTEVGSLIGTLEYMSPEQAELTNLDIDTRSDIYALGVILYELLTGSVPFARRDLEAAGLAEMLRIIKEVEPQKPSTRLSGSGELPSVAAVRQMEPRKLANQVRGELDWIVMKCLEKDRGRRYETANGLAMEIQRYLNEEPVLAGPPSPTYRLRKFVRRNKGPVLAASLLALTLVGGVITTSWQWQRAIRERNDKEHALIAEERERKTAQSAEADTKAFGDFLTKRVLAAARPKDVLGGLGVDVTVARALEEAEKSISEDFAGRPRAEAKARQALGETWWKLTSDAFPRAEQHLRRAIALREREAGPDHADTLESQNSLGALLIVMGRFPDAIDVLQHVRDRLIATRGFEHTDTLLTLANLAEALRRAGRHSEALALLQQICDQQIKSLGNDHPDTNGTKHELANAYHVSGRIDEAIKLHEQVRDHLLKTKGADHPYTLGVLNNLAGAYHFAGRPREAIPIYEQVREQQVKTLGPEHPQTLITLGNLAAAYLEVGRAQEAIAVQEVVRDLQIKRQGFNHPDTLTTLTNLAGAYQGGNRQADAIALYEKVRDRTIELLGPDHPDTLSRFARLGVAYQAAGRIDNALVQFEKACQGIEKRKFQHEHALGILGRTSACYEQAKQFEKAETWRRKCVTLARERSGPESLACASELAALGHSLEHQKKHADAETMLRECLTIREAKAPDDWRTSNTRSLLGGTLVGLKKHAEAEPHLIAGYEGLKKVDAKTAAQIKGRKTEALNRLITLYEEWGKPDEAAKWRAELKAISEQ